MFKSSLSRKCSERGADENYQSKRGTRSFKQGTASDSIITIGSPMLRSRLLVAIFVDCSWQTWKSGTPPSRAARGKYFIPVGFDLPRTYCRSFRATGEGIIC